MSTGAFSFCSNSAQTMHIRTPDQPITEGKSPSGGRMPADVKGPHRRERAPSCHTSVHIGSAAVRCRSSDETPWSPPLIDFQSSRRPPVAMCYCRRSVVCYCRSSTLEQSTCWRPVCLVAYNISSEAENSFISAILPRHCFITASP